MAPTTTTTTLPPPKKDADAATIKRWLIEEWWLWVTEGSAGLEEYFTAFEQHVTHMPHDEVKDLYRDAVDAAKDQGDETDREYINNQLVDYFAGDEVQIFGQHITPAQVKTEHARGVAAVDAAETGLDLQTPLGQYLRAHGHMYDQFKDDDNKMAAWVVSDEAKAALTTAANMILIRSGGIQETGTALTWEEIYPLIGYMPPHQLDHVIETAFPQAETDWQMVEAPTGGMVGAPTALVAVVRRQLPGLTTAALHGAFFASAGYGVAWAYILFAADELGKIKPPTSPPTVDTATGAIVPGLPAAPNPTDLDSVARRLAEGKELYEGDMAFALVHAVDPQLAARVRNFPSALTTDDVDRLNAIVKDLDYYSNNEGTPSAPSSLRVMKALQPGGEIAEDREVKPDALRDSYETLYTAWFLTQPTDAELDAFSDHFDDELDAYQRARLGGVKNPFDAELVPETGTGRWGTNIPVDEGPSVDAPGFTLDQPDLGATARTWLRAGDMYKPLFANKPGGMTEEDYVQAFATQAQSSLGAGPGSLATGSIQAGMRSGDPRDVTRHAVMSMNPSSTLSEKLARSGQIFRRLT